MKFTNVFLILLILLSGCVHKKKTTNYVEKIDHILLIPDNSKELFDLFVNTFGLFVAWPYQDFGGFYSGGVNVGNVNLEMLFFEDYNFNGIFGLAFEPTVQTLDVKKGLEDRGIICGEPDTYDPRWTSLDITNILQERAIFFCEFHILTNSTFNSNNPMQIEKANEITINVANYKEALDYWGTLFEPVKPSPIGYWELGSGPAIKLQEGKKDEIVSIQLKVKSLEKAKEFLKDNELLGDQKKDSIFTNPDRTNQILFEFKE